MGFFPFNPGAGGGFTNPMTTAGDMIDATTGGAAQRLALGSGGQVLTVSTGAPTWLNSAAGFANPMTTAGDMIDATTGGTAQRLAIGSTGQGLQVVTGAPAWANTVNSLAAADTSIVVAGTALAPTVATGTLDVIAADHPPAANWSNNSHKITSLANGSGAQDAAAFGQIPLADATAAHIAADGTQTAGANGAWADSGHIHPELLPFSAVDAGYLAWAWDPGPNLVASTALTNNTIYLIRINIRQNMSVTNVITYLTAGTSLTANENFAGLYNSSGTLIAATADQTSNWASSGLKTMALASGPFALTGGTFVWMALLCNGTGTIIAPIRGQNQTAAAQNAGFTASTARWATAGTGTSLGNITPSSNTIIGLSIWGALS